MISDQASLFGIKTQPPKNGYCPLKFIAGETIGYECEGEACAWFVTWRGHEQCAAKVLAHSVSALKDNADAA